MVSIEEKSNYLQKFEPGNDFCFLRDFLQNKPIDNPNEDSSLVHKLIFSLVSNEIGQSKDLIEDYSAKKPNSDSQFIYKDLLIFLFICVTRKFNLSQHWILNFLNQRNDSEEENKSITKTFENLINNNLESKDNYFEIIIVYKYILGDSETNENLLNETYEKISNKNFPFYNSEFLNLISFKALDIIILLKGVTSFREYQELKSFSNKFDKRTFQIVQFFFYSILTSIICYFCYVIYKLFYGTSDESGWADKMLTVTGFIGLVLAIVGYSNRSEIIVTFQNIIKKFFGKIENKVSG